MVLSYHTFLRPLCCFISGYALETRSLRDVGLSFAHDTRMRHMIIRSLALPSVCSFSQFGSSTLDLPKHRVMHTHTVMYTSTSPLIFRGCAFSNLVSLTNRIYSSMASSLILGRLVPSSLASLTNRVPSTTDYQTLGSRHRYLCPIGTLGEEDSALPRWSEKNQPRSQEI